MDKSERKRILQTYITASQQSNMNHKQRSPEWYKARLNSIGGSEMATIMNENKYKTRNSFIREKAFNSSTFKGNEATRWGILFEPLTKLWSEQILGMEESITEMPSIQGFADGQHYSPDGIGLVLLKNIDNVAEYYIVLFEFKAPYRSIPDGRIPTQYISQVQAGLHSMPIVDIAIFVNNMYRRCLIEHLGFSGVCLDVNAQYETAISCGVVFFYVDMEFWNAFQDFSLGKSDLYDFQASDFAILNSEKLVDFSTSSSFSRLLQLTEDQRVCSDFSLIFHNKDEIKNIDIVSSHDIKVPCVDEKTIPEVAKTRIETYAKECEDKKKKAIGFLPWKLIKSDVIIEERDDKWLSKAKPQLAEALKEIQQLRQTPPVEECEHPFGDELIDY